MRDIRKSVHAGLGVALAVLAFVPVARAASQPVAAAETEISIDAAFMHSQYHENLLPGDDESGYTPGFGVGISALLPVQTGPDALDIYSSLTYDLSAGNIHYGGHFLNGTPLGTTDHAVFNRLEARVGLGFPVFGASELIPFLAGGYQAWNRNDAVKGDQYSYGEFYRAGLIGGGVKLDIPLSRVLVVSGTAEILALVGGSIDAPKFGFAGGFGPTPEERLSLGADYALTPELHSFATGYWEHFTYAGTKPDIYGTFEPLSTTTEFGTNIGLAYSF